MMMLSACSTRSDQIQDDDWYPTEMGQAWFVVVRFHWASRAGEVIAGAGRAFVENQH